MYNKSHPQTISEILSEFKVEISRRVSDAQAIAEVLERIYDWVGEEPTLTTIICNYVIKYAAQVSAEDAELLVDQIVREEILLDWETNSAAEHLTAIRDALLDPDKKDAFLIAYIKVLQRGKVRADHSSEQEVLLKSGLVSMNRRKLRVSNMLYEQIFDLDWVEAQLPGITRPVLIGSDRTKQSLSTIKLYPKAIAALCGVALLGATAFAYMRASSSRAFANQNLTISKTDKDIDNPSSETSPAIAVPLADIEGVEDKTLFNVGIEHGQNGRWVPMFREFCGLNKGSVYFDPAKEQLAQWNRLFPEGIEAAADTMTYETLRAGETCLLAEDY